MTAGLKVPEPRFMLLFEGAKTWQDQTQGSPWTQPQLKWSLNERLNEPTLRRYTSSRYTKLKQQCWFWCRSRRDGSKWGALSYDTPVALLFNRVISPFAIDKNDATDVNLYVGLTFSDNVIQLLLELRILVVEISEYGLLEGAESGLRINITPNLQCLTFLGVFGIARKQLHCVGYMIMTTQDVKILEAYRLHISRIIEGVRPERTDCAAWA